jgi:hypothetical protein
MWKLAFIFVPALPFIFLKLRFALIHDEAEKLEMLRRYGGG